MNVSLVYVRFLFFSFLFCFDLLLSFFVCSWKYKRLYNSTALIRLWGEGEGGVERFLCLITNLISELVNPIQGLLRPPHLKVEYL